MIVDEYIEFFKPFRVVVFGGAAAKRDIVKKLVNFRSENNLNFTLINGYGPAENSCFTATYSFVNNERFLLEVPVGTPIANTQVYILDKFNHVLPPLVPGEICTGGDGLAIEYLSNPELTKSSFNQVCLDHKNALRLYKTGDQGFWYPNGVLGFVKRKDKQIKVSGFRVELDGVEKKIKDCSVIRDAVVIFHSEYNVSTLMAFVMFNDKSNDNMSTLYQFLIEEMPYYMRPKIYERDYFPLNANGKIDRSLLLQQVLEVGDTSWSFKETSNETEKALVKIWKKLLNLSEINIDQNYFDFGVTSIGLIQASHLINDKISERGKISVMDLFRYPTVRSLANHIQNMTSEKEGVFYQPVSVVGRDEN